MLLLDRSISREVILINKGSFFIIGKHLLTSLHESLTFRIKKNC